MSILPKQKLHERIDRARIEAVYSRRTDVPNRFSREELRSMRQLKFDEGPRFPLGLINPSEVADLILVLLAILGFVGYFRGWW